MQTLAHPPPANNLDSPDYDPIDHLNAIFSHPSTLSTADQVTSALRNHQFALDAQIGSLTESQRTNDAESVQRIQAAKAALPALFQQIDGVRTRAMQTELSIADMTADIKKLDNTKRNLTLSMTALKRLQMLTTAYEQLRGLARSRQYRECGQLLQAVMQLVQHFKSYRSIDQIAALHRNIVELQEELLKQVCDDFEKAFAQDAVADRKGMLSEGCFVMDALGEGARSRLISWYCNTELREYRQVFRGNDEAGSLDNISRRYSWFSRMLKTYDRDHASIFPPHWRVGEMLANAFCEGTRDDFKAILQRSVQRTDGQPLDVNLLLSCLQETMNFEHGLEKRFIGESRASIDTTVSRDDRPLHVGQIISEAFEPYMTLWVESQDKQLATLIPTYRQQPVRNLDEEDFSSQAVIPSSTELFHFYRLAMNQCAKLSTGSRLLELSRTFGKYLDLYCQQVLLYFLVDRPGPQGPSLEDTIIILNTADYCFLTCNQLEEKIRSKIDEDIRGEVDLQGQADAFIGVSATAIRVLVRKVEASLDHVWKEMKNFPWGKLDTVVDQSSYVPEMLRLINERSTETLRYLHKPQYSRSFCDNLVDSWSMSYCANVFQCKPISEGGAEQMLLDSYALKKDILQIPVLTAERGTQPPAAFIKRATQSTLKIDSLLKTLQVRPSPPEALVQAYLIHIADRSEANFKKILDLKGIRKIEQGSLVDLFNAHCQSDANRSLPSASTFMSSLQAQAAAGSAPGGGASHSGGTATSGVGGRDPHTRTSSNGSPLGGGRFDPSTFGSAIMNAAREGVDRLGSPSGGEGGAALDRPGDATAASNLNENLKNFGRFFKRDGGAFSRFGRGGAAGESVGR